MNNLSKRIKGQRVDAETGSSLCIELADHCRLEERLHTGRARLCNHQPLGNTPDQLKADSAEPACSYEGNRQF